MCATPSTPSILSRALSSTRHAEDLPLPLGPTIIRPWCSCVIWYSCNTWGKGERSTEGSEGERSTEGSEGEREKGARRVVREKGARRVVREKGVRTVVREKGVRRVVREKGVGSKAGGRRQEGEGGKGFKFETSSSKASLFREWSSSNQPRLTLSSHCDAALSASPTVRCISTQTLVISALSSPTSADLYLTPGNTSVRRLCRRGMSSATSLGTTVSHTLWIRI